jgi:transcriptional pleiotropic regulator of transition state genes
MWKEESMKSTGIVRKVDDLGRVVIPIELRKNMNINEGNSLEIYVDGEHIIIKKYQPGCISCGSMDYKTTKHGTRICLKCIEGAK